MEIKSIKLIGNKFYFGFKCTECKKDVCDEDKYCRHCGRKLEPIQRVENLLYVSSILTAAFKGLPLPPKKEPEEQKPVNEPQVYVADGSDSISVDDDSSISMKSPSGARTTMTEQNQDRCPRCKSKKEGCEFLSEDGECHGVVFPTFPPQFGECVY